MKFEVYLHFRELEIFMSFSAFSDEKFQEQYSASA